MSVKNFKSILLTDKFRIHNIKWLARLVLSVLLLAFQQAFTQDLVLENRSITTLTSHSAKSIIIGPDLVITDTGDLTLSAERVSVIPQFFILQGGKLDIISLVDNSETPTSVDITFNVRVPDGTPAQDLIYLVGNFNYWDPGPGEGSVDEEIPLTKIGSNEWQMTLPFIPGASIQYKYTRGSWETVEKSGQGSEIPNRVFVVPGDNQTLNDRVENWSDIIVSVHQQGTDLIPGPFKMDQNYPNPFNPETTIEFTLPEAAFVTLQLYNTVGEKVVTLVSEKLPAGHQRCVLSANNMANGIYFYRLRADAYTAVRKLLILK